MANNYLPKILYHDHNEIPPMTRSYILSVSDADNIYDIPIAIINDFLTSLYDYETPSASTKSSTTTKE